MALWALSLGNERANHFRLLGSQIKVYTHIMSQCLACSDSKATRCVPIRPDKCLSRPNGFVSIGRRDKENWRLLGSSPKKDKTQVKRKQCDANEGNVIRVVGLSFLEKYPDSIAQLLILHMLRGIHCLILVSLSK